MAKILYGVHGDGHGSGHAIRALTVARQFPEHEFLFLCHAVAADLIRREYPVVECPNPGTPIRNHKVATGTLISSNLSFFWRQSGLMKSVMDLMDRFQPDVALTDYEYFVPRASRRAGLPCLSLDHQHIIPFCSHAVPLSQYHSYLATGASIRYLFSRASDYISVSFFDAPLKPNGPRCRIAPPLLREKVLRQGPREGEHVVAYQSATTFRRFFPFLQGIGRPVMVYGFNTEKVEGNLQFKKHSEEGFLEDLASCSYAICGGGHGMISEALFYGKPVISFPISNMFEQYLNAFYLDRLGYGRCVTRFKPGPGLIADFEAHLDHYRRNIGTGNFCGNAEVYSLVDHFIRHKRLP